MAFLSPVTLPYALNRKEGLQNYFISIGKPLPEDFNILEDDIFMDALKLYIHFNIPPLESKNSNIFPIFKNLFGNFKILYKTYVELQISHRVVFSSLITFFNKSFGRVENIYYNKLLKNVKDKMSGIMKHVIAYLWSNQEEADFYKFLYNVNKEAL